jgi:hypothetical protein
MQSSHMWYTMSSAPYSNFWDTYLETQETQEEARCIGVSTVPSLQMPVTDSLGKHISNWLSMQGVASSLLYEINSEPKAMREVMANLRHRNRWVLAEKRDSLLVLLPNIHIFLRRVLRVPECRDRFFGDFLKRRA